MISIIIPTLNEAKIIESTHMADTGYRMKNPVHPGAFIRSEILEPLELSVTDVARVLDVSPTKPFHAAERGRGPVPGHGLADREGVRRPDGYAYAHRRLIPLSQVARYVV
jgi:hypothetical protein